MAPLHRPVVRTWHRDSSTLFSLSDFAPVPLPLSLPHSLFLGLQYTPIYLSQASAVSSSVSALRALVRRKAWHLSVPKNRVQPLRTSASFC